MPDLTHAVYDALTGERVSDPMGEPAATAECSRMGGAAMGYAVDIWPPAWTMATAERPREPAAAVPKLKVPDGPGLFD